ncbi:DUF4227 family protein [Paenibacillus donghaensis]|uniref:DUF4227 domain-containing protein n=1 Tax=Paenibacillus donghaensis TaxID=414771 RepID=A0A2Z2KIM0_9BACL|nr:DUF4227 family protein [Paenibacillus donghaensis]ASA23070.1 hypothetical protein B9T62_21030 [Paenibacillus donghaensis]
MIISIPKTVRRMYLFILFIALSWLIYSVMSWVGEWISPADNYGIPEGTAVKAFQNVHQGGDGLSTGERLRFYYWYGE